MATLRLRTLTVRCRHRQGRGMEEAHDAAVEIARFHGWPSGTVIMETCGCFTIYRSRPEAEAAIAGKGLTGSWGTPAPGDPMPGRALMH